MRLYPDKDLPYSNNIELDQSYIVSQIGVKSDWWKNRPTKITILDSKSNKVIAKKIFADYKSNICGYEFKSKCSHPDFNGSATSTLLIKLNKKQRLDQFTLKIEGLLSKANKYVIIKDVRIYGEY